MRLVRMKGELKSIWSSLISLPSTLGTTLEPNYKNWINIYYLWVGREEMGGRCEEEGKILDLRERNRREEWTPSKDILSTPTSLSNTNSFQPPGGKEEITLSSTNIFHRSFWLDRAHKNRLQIPILQSSSTPRKVKISFIKMSGKKQNSPIDPWNMYSLFLFGHRPLIELLLWIIYWNTVT